MQCRLMINEAVIQKTKKGLRLLHMLPAPRTERFPLVQVTSTEHMPAADDQGVDVIEIIYGACSDFHLAGEGRGVPVGRRDIVHEFSRAAWRCPLSYAPGIISCKLALLLDGRSAPIARDPGEVPLGWRSFLKTLCRVLMAVPSPVVLYIRIYPLAMRKDHPRCQAAGCWQYSHHRPRGRRAG